MRKILIPTDFSNNAYNAIRYAMHFFKNEKCTFYLLNTFTPASYNAEYLIESPTLYGLEDVAMVNSKKEITKIEERIKDEFNNPKHEFIRLSAFNTLIEEIKDVIEKHTIQLIVIGTKGATGAKEVFLGNNTHRIVKNVKNVPIFVVPEGAVFEGVTNIGFATDYKKIYHKSEIAPIKYLAKINNATIRMIHVYDKPELSEIQHYNATVLEHFFKKIPYDFHVIPDFSTTENAIQVLIKELEIDVLTMVYYPHSFIERLIREPVIKKMTFHIDIPFLVIPSDN